MKNQYIYNLYVLSRGRVVVCGGRTHVFTKLVFSRCIFPFHLNSNRSCALLRSTTNAPYTIFIKEKETIRNIISVTNIKAIHFSVLMNFLETI